MSTPEIEEEINLLEDCSTAADELGDALVGLAMFFIGLGVASAGVPGGLGASAAALLIAIILLVMAAIAYGIRDDYDAIILDLKAICAKGPNAVVGTPLPPLVGIPNLPAEMPEFAHTLALEMVRRRLLLREARCILRIPAGEARASAGEEFIPRFTSHALRHASAKGRFFAALNTLGISWPNGDLDMLVPGIAQDSGVEDFARKLRDAGLLDSETLVDKAWAATQALSPAEHEKMIDLRLPKLVQDQLGLTPLDAAAGLLAPADSESARNAIEGVTRAVGAELAAPVNWRQTLATALAS